MKNGFVLDFHDSVPARLAASDKLVFSDRSYCYSLCWSRKGEKYSENKPQNIKLGTNILNKTRASYLITGTLGPIAFKHELIHSQQDSYIEEKISINNESESEVRIEDIKFGFRKSLSEKESFRLIAVPFRVQVDGKVHDYSTQDFLDEKFTNSNEPMSWAEGIPPLSDNGKLRSEAWLMTFNENDLKDSHKIGLLIAKYNNQNIEMSVAEVERKNETANLIFGGVGFSLFNEPHKATILAPGETFNFGATRYEIYNGGISDGYALYKKWLNDKGHGFPKDYNPPVNWNELYDVGWYHSNPEKLKQFYTREALMEEARKAAEIGCELLYLDPGWEVCEGTALWDEVRLGTPKDFTAEVKKRYGIDVGYRDTGYLYRDEFPHQWYWKGKDKDERGQKWRIPNYEDVWRFCACCKEYRDEKIRRLRKITEQGLKFMMFDEYAWFGPCYAKDHGHPAPSTPEEHVRGMYEIIEKVRETSPDLLVEAHDPVWPWAVRYLPVYYRQGFGAGASYQENWGFEFMWDCLNDLKSGRAMSLYYYAMATDIPLYLHISMIPDNDNCVFFWWAASTVRHLGIGGKYHNLDPRIQEKYGADPEKRWNAYKEAMNLYKSLKPYFVRGEFYGVHEYAHLHTLDGKNGGVLCLFNLHEEKMKIGAEIPLEKLHLKKAEQLRISGDAIVERMENKVIISADLPPMSARIICIGDAVNNTKK